MNMDYLCNLIWLQVLPHAIKAVRMTPTKYKNRDKSVGNNKEGEQLSVAFTVTFASQVGEMVSKSMLPKWTD